MAHGYVAMALRLCGVVRILGSLDAYQCPGPIYICRFLSFVFRFELPIKKLDPRVIEFRLFESQYLFSSYQDSR